MWAYITFSYFLRMAELVCTNKNFLTPQKKSLTLLCRCTSSCYKCEFEVSRYHLAEGNITWRGVTNNLQERTNNLDDSVLSCLPNVHARPLWIVYYIVLAASNEACKCNLRLWKRIALPLLDNLRNWSEHMAGSALRYGETAGKMLQDQICVNLVWPRPFVCVCVTLS